MSTNRTERFNFETSPYLLFASVGTTNATTALQDVSLIDPFQVINPGIAETIARVEPEQVIGDGNGHHVLDLLSRMIILSHRAGGTGTWTGGIKLRRAVSATNEHLINWVIPLSTTPLVTVIDNPLPHDFAKSIGGGEALSDVFSIQAEVTPGQAAAHEVSITVLLVPGFASNESNKGANLSALPFLSAA